MSKTDDEIKALIQAEVEKKVKAALAPTQDPTEAEIAAHNNARHQANERRMANATYFSPEDYRKMREAAPDDVVRGIVADGRAPIGPTSIIPRKPTSSNAREPINTTGWQHPTSLKNGLGQGR